MQADALYILGDLFEAWLGDDLVPPEYEPALQALRKLTAQNVPVYVAHGNRDFLLADGFIDQTGCELLSESTTIDLYGEPTLLVHGDTLCTDDVEYQKFRQLVRDPHWQREFTAKSPEERIETTSSTDDDGTSDQILDIDDDETVDTSDRAEGSLAD